MAPPTYLDNAIPNNTFMKPGQKVDRPRAMRQYQRVKHMLQALGVTPTAMEVIVPSYLWRFRKTGQFQHNGA